MGWTFQECSKKELIEELIKDAKPLDYHLDDFSGTESVLWMLIDTKLKKYGKRVICYYIGRRKIDKKIMWGYKDVDDMMGPCVYTCPLRLIEASTPMKDEYLKIWRDEVYKYWKNEKTKR
jgi:hypothetical protein